VRTFYLQGGESALLFMPFRKKFSSNESYNEYFRKYRLDNLEKIREYKREYAKKYRKKNNYKNEKACAARHPEKKRAREIVSNAIQNKKIKKYPCEICGQTEKIQAHHEDYTKPLEIIWLCAKHHNEYHVICGKVDLMLYIKMLS
jgi:hypothetical protein